MKPGGCHTKMKAEDTSTSLVKSIQFQVDVTAPHRITYIQITTAHDDLSNEMVHTLVYLVAETSFCFYL